MSSRMLLLLLSHFKNRNSSRRKQECCFPSLIFREQKRRRFQDGILKLGMGPNICKGSREEFVSFLLLFPFHGLHDECFLFERSCFLRVKSTNIFLIASPWRWKWSRLIMMRIGFKLRKIIITLRKKKYRARIRFSCTSSILMYELVANFMNEFSRSCGILKWKQVSFTTSHSFSISFFLPLFSTRIDTNDWNWRWYQVTTRRNFRVRVTLIPPNSFNFLSLSPLIHSLGQHSIRFQWILNVNISLSHKHEFQPTESLLTTLTLSPNHPYSIIIPNLSAPIILEFDIMNKIISGVGIKAREEEERWRWRKL